MVKFSLQEIKMDLVGIGEAFWNPMSLHDRVWVEI